MKMVIAVGVAFGAFGAQATTLYSNGPVVDGQGLSTLTRPVSSVGFPKSAPVGFPLARNFRVTGADWAVASLDFYGYQPNSGGFPFASVTWSVLGGNDINTATVVASGTTSATNGGPGNDWLTWGLLGTAVTGSHSGPCWTPPVVGSLGVAMPVRVSRAS